MTQEVATDALAATRARTLALLDLVPERDQIRQVDPLMSPLCWDLAHIGHYEELWVLRNLAGATGTDPRFDDVYDAFAHPRAERTELDALDPTAARAFDADVRARVERLDPSALDAANPLLTGDFVYGLVVQHEHQHIETMLATIQLLGEDFRARLPIGANSMPALPAEVELPGGEFTMGTDDEPWAYDNERPAHTVMLAPFAIDTTAVTVGAYEEFVAAGGYDDPTFWTTEGWKWRQEGGLTAPQFWYDDGTLLRFGHRIGRDPREPVQHVCWYEADAYARWKGKRLPTEMEWEYAAIGSSTDGAYLANGPDEHWGPTTVGLYPPTPPGVHDLLGNVWEWTASDFVAYPGFRSFPYREYSEVFFGSEYKVLRGGSWATHPFAMRSTWRNWDYPIRRQIFAGFRCARDL